MENMDPEQLKEMQEMQGGLADMCVEPRASSPRASWPRASSPCAVAVRRRRSHLHASGVSVRTRALPPRPHVRHTPRRLNPDKAKERLEASKKELKDKSARRAK